MNKFIRTPRYYWNKQAIDKQVETILKVITVILFAVAVYFLFTNY
jgi:hypothetical protein